MHEQQALRQPPPPPPPSGARQEVFALDEGDVTLVYPADLSPTSYQDLEDYMQVFLRKAKRQAEARQKALFERAEQSIPKSLGGSAEDDEEGRQ